jgi:DNA-binding IclR family transcriptional regulator
LLGALTALGPGPQRLRDVAARAGLDPSTAHRILQAAIRTGAVSKTGHGRYSLTGPVEPRAERADAGRMPSPMQAVSGRSRLALAALQEATEQTVLLYVPVLVDVPMRYCLAYLAAEPDEFGVDADRLLASDIVCCAPMSTDAPGRAILAHLPLTRSANARNRTGGGIGYTFGPSPVPGWWALTAPIHRYGHVAGAVCLTAQPSWLERHREVALKRLLSTAADLGREMVV